MSNKRGGPVELPAHGNTKYPWVRWTNGKTHKAVRLIDFDVSADSFRSLLRVRAMNYNLKVTTRVRGDAVWFQFSAKELG